VYEQQKQFDAAIRELTTSRALGPRSSRSIALLAHAFAAAGNRAEALRLLTQLTDRARQQYVPALDFAIDRTCAIRPSTRSGPIPGILHSCTA
jgi:hypothetical protein